MVEWISGYVKLFCFVMRILFIIFPVFLYCYYLLCVYYILFQINEILSTSGSGHKLTYIQRDFSQQD